MIKINTWTQWECRECGSNHFKVVGHCPMEPDNPTLPDKDVCHGLVQCKSCTGPQRHLECEQCHTVDKDSEVVVD